MNSISPIEANSLIEARICNQIIPQDENSAQKYTVTIISGRLAAVKQNATIPVQLTCLMAKCRLLKYLTICKACQKCTKIRLKCLSINYHMQYCYAEIWLRQLPFCTPKLIDVNSSSASVTVLWRSWKSLDLYPREEWSVGTRTRRDWFTYASSGLTYVTWNQHIPICHQLNSADQCLYV